MATLEKNPPVHKIQNGRVQASIWEQTSEKGKFLSVTFKIGYQQQSEWKNGHSYQAHELDALIDTAIDAKEWMRQHRLSKAKAA
ncbi:MAG: hypothetical protein OEZ57_00775 [Nitrospirota bacterium]|nr:hypothetical protein [Nitrospira sp.]MCA9479872.1 hypothetical protein [Nitrospira sp.]MDH5457079.1 hypothetical protein [Nitrospinota bacterium]MDH5585170.1 hypothetical protein [Nitrospirota bacterium]MDH5773431.1 hypothetical protein [Nitrospirota bacterium]